ncbi:MAG: HDIG domain-containing protein [Flavobacteriaceae bacterium]|nr:HDIG domain-containing protein [Flavobacteriaceae bacterium]
MKDKLNIFFKLQSQIYRIILYLLSVFIIIYIIPKKGKFQYDFKEGKPWKYETLISPFDFLIQKSESEINFEKFLISKNATKYFNKNLNVSDSIISIVNTKLNDSFPNLFQQTKEILNKIYEPGLVNNSIEIEADSVFLISKINKSKIRYDELNKTNDYKIDSIIYNSLEDSFQLHAFLRDILIADVVFDKETTNSNLNKLLNQISHTKGLVSNGVRIISRGEIVDADKFGILNSLKMKFESQLWSKSNFNWITLGYSIIVGITLFFLLLFLKKNRISIYLNNTKITFIFLIILIFISITIAVFKYQPDYIYVVPLCSIPLLLRAFFDSRLGLFVHVLTLLILGFIVPNNFEFLFLHTIAGIITILTPSDLYQRANLFVSVSIITCVYILSYFSISIIANGDISYIDLNIPLLFIFNGLATLFVHPLIYIFEKIFGLVSDVSLLELTNTNSKLLKELSEKAPGTFYHSLAVSNLAEAVATQISANVMLVRVGALYHDIGKMNNPNYFIENQSNSFNPHNELEPLESSNIIKDHISNGIEIAKRNRLPDRVIDFIRTHHGTSMIKFFYDKAIKSKVDSNESDFRYSGPKPFSKETAIVMMADSIEAASKSIKEPNVKLIENFVDKIINTQIEDNQFENCNITLKELNLTKKILKEKLNNIYHLRVEYPD